MHVCECPLKFRRCVRVCECGSARFNASEKGSSLPQVSEGMQVLESQALAVRKAVRVRVCPPL